MEKIIIDCDTGIDDFSAIVLAVKSKKFDILGVTTVTGNCSLKNATRNALKALEMASASNIKVYKGMDEPITKQTKDFDATYVHGENGFSNVEYEDPKQKEESESAIDFLIRTINENPQDITLVQIGPLTNLATAINKDSSIVGKVKRVVLMGGAEHEGNCTKTSEFNFYKDANAAKIVFEAGFKEIVMLGLDVTTKVVLNSKLENLLKQSKNDNLAQFIYDISRNGAAFDRENSKTDGSIMHDPTVIGYLLDNNLVKLKDAFVKISTNNENLGQSLVDNNYLLNGHKPNCRVAYDIDSVGFLKLFFNTVFENLKDETEKIL